MQNIYEYVIRKTMEVARSMINDASLDIDLEDIEIGFSLGKTRCAATCWPNQYRILYYRRWLEANNHNTRFIDDMIIHECAHLVTGIGHDKRFYKLCREYGALYEDFYFEDRPYHIGIPPYIVEKYGEIECN